MQSKDTKLQAGASRASGQKILDDLKAQMGANRPKTMPRQRSPKLNV